MSMPDSYRVMMPEPSRAAPCHWTCWDQVVSSFSSLVWARAVDRDEREAEAASFSAWARDSENLGRMLERDTVTWVGLGISSGFLNSSG